MLRKLLLVAIAILALTANLYAQKSRMYVNDFSKARSVAEDDFQKIRAAVISAFDGYRCFELHDVTVQDLMAQEVTSIPDRSVVSDEAAVIRNGQVKVTDNYILDCNVTSCTVESSAKDGKTTFVCKLTYSVTVTDIDKCAIVAMGEFFNSPVAFGGYCVYCPDNKSTSAESAKTDAFNSIGPNIANFLAREFPLKGEIFAKDYVVKKGKLVNCNIDLGSNAGVMVGDMFAIMEVCTKVGRLVECEIGRLQVVEVGDEMSGCKVVSGEKKVKNAMESYLDGIKRDSNAKALVVKSIHGSLLMFQQLGF